jgi:hypothetical protein
MSNDDFAELRKKTAAKRFGQPPTESTDNMAPEPVVVTDPALEIPVPQRIDGRTLRRSGRTLGFSTRVTEDWDYRLKRYAARNNLMIVEVLERALDALEREEAARKKPDCSNSKLV